MKAAVEKSYGKRGGKIIESNFFLNNLLLFLFPLQLFELLFVLLLTLI